MSERKRKKKVREDFSQFHGRFQERKADLNFFSRLLQNVALNKKRFDSAVSSWRPFRRTSFIVIAFLLKAV